MISVFKWKGVRLLRMMLNMPIKIENELIVCLIKSMDKPLFISYQLKTVY
jgi:hypothetical protein